MSATVTPLGSSTVVMEHKKDSSGHGGPYLPARYVFVVVKVVSSFAGSLMDGSLPLAITVMVGKTGASQVAYNGTLPSGDVCPTSDSHQTTRAVQQEDAQVEGTNQRPAGFDWDELTQSFVTNGSSYGIFISILAGARLAELWSPKLLMVYTSIVYSAVHMLVPVLARWSVYALIASRVIYGVAIAPSSPALTALMAAWFPPDERQMLNSIMTSMLSLGTIVSTSLSGFLISEYGWEPVFYLYGGLHLSTGLLYVYFVYDSPQQHPRISDAEKDHIVRSVNKQPKMSAPVPWRQMMASKPLWAHISAVVGTTWVQYIFNTELPTYLRRMLHYDTAKTGYISSAIHGTAWFTQIFFGVVSRCLRRNKCLSLLTTYKIFNAIAMLGPMVTLVAVTQAGCDATLIVSLLVVHHAVSSAFMAGSVLNHMDLAINFAPTVSAFVSTAANAVAVAAPTVAGTLINNQETLSAWSKVFYISAAVSAVPYAIFFVFGSTDEQPWNRPPESPHTAAEDSQLAPGKADEPHLAGKGASVLAKS